MKRNSAENNGAIRRVTNSASVAAVLCAMTFASAVQAESITIASFADPSQSETMPLFEFDAGTFELSGEWSGSGLTLETATGNFDDVTFVMSALDVDAFGGTSGGEINFRDSGNTLIYRITFGSGHMNALGFGATEFLATDVVAFSGSILPAPVFDESFAFAFANQTSSGPGGSFTATASFTSSAEVVPEPASVALLFVGALVLVRRHRRTEFTL